MEEAWMLGRGQWRGEIDTEGELTVAYLAPTVAMRNWLIEERMRDEVHVAEVHGQVTYQPWKLPAEMNADRMRERKRRPWVKVFKPSLLAAKWMRGAVEYFFGPIVSEQRVDDEQREYVRYVLDGPMKNPLKSSVAVAIGAYSFEEVRVVTSETPFCEVCFTHGHMGLHGRCLTPSETLQEMHEREVISTMDPILQSNPQEERRAWHELELQVDDALLKEARIAGEARKEAASQACHEERRRKPAKGRGRYRRNVLWEGRGDDPMQTDDPHWVFGEDRKRKAEQGPEQEKGSKTGSLRQEQGTGGDQRERDAESSSAKSGKEVGDGGQTQSSEGFGGSKKGERLADKKEGRREGLLRERKGSRGTELLRPRRMLMGEKEGGGLGYPRAKGDKAREGKKRRRTIGRTREEILISGMLSGSDLLLRQGGIDARETMGQETSGRQVSSQTSQTRPKCTRERQRSPLGTKGYEPRYSLRGKEKRNESPPPSGSVPLKEPSFGLPAEGVGDQSSCQDDDNSLESSTTETSDSSEDDQQSGHRSANQQQQDCSAEGGAQGSARQQQQERSVEEEHHTSRGQGSEERATPAEAASAENRSTQEQESQQRQQPESQLEGLARQERMGARLPDILRAGEGYVCPIVLWRAPEEIRLLLEGATDVPTFGVARPPREQQVLKKVAEWLGPRYEVVTLPQISALRFVRETAGGDEYVIFVFFVEAIPKRPGVPRLGSAGMHWIRFAEAYGPAALSQDYHLVHTTSLALLNSVNACLPLMEHVGGMKFQNGTDSYRTLHPQERAFTFWGNTVTRRSRIDMIWASGELNETGEQVRIVPMATSDHSAVIATFPVGRLEIGRPPKAIPAWVFKSPEYGPVIVKFWEDWAEDCTQEQLLPQVITAVQTLRHILQKLLRGNYLAHKKTGEEYAQRMEELDKGPEEGQIEEEWWAERVEAARGWREWQAEEAVKWGRRTKETWITLGERMSRQFFATVATKKAAPIMTAMDHPFDGQMEQQRTTRGILKCVTDFYRQLLTEEEQWTPEEMAGEPELDIWSHVQSRLNLAETCKLEEDITEEEVVSDCRAP
ncbi:hypothetical protein CBR_g51327 [Chara braunii]|uniref:Endonuclease/exonuclease/phosphatase domain-containing protein n=1 Tax=Chara braunii TaxID=69332 RepID=A0A388M8N6_CHABU|nr:hypothetical protein CBR_g51327 [Chara braunii]|eukprot:GBG90822.1 hypothetical protein CBR_g51327 [Chara braunii]